MSVTIGHSAIDENGKASNGKAGDQTKREVCFSKWYSASWDVVLRPKTKELAEKSAIACEAGCNNNNIGYDQHQRNTLYSCAKEVDFDLSKIKTPCECDCSSFMHVCAIAGGANLTYGSNGYTTRSMVKAFERSGDYEVLSEKKYLTSDKYLKRGDVLVREGYHTIMALENGSGDSEKKESYKVQVGSYSVEKNAKNFLKEVQKDVPDAFITTVKGKYKIQVGSYSVKSNAEKQLKKMKELGYTDAFITK